MKKQQKPSSRDVAKLAGVSQSTVSFVLNNRTDMKISPLTQQKVFQAAQQLNYIPNQFARGLKTNQSKLIGLVVPTITNPFYPMVTQYVEEYSASKGYNILLCNTYRDTTKEEFYLNLLAERSVDGLIFAFTPQVPDVLKSMSKQIPVVILGEKDKNLGISTVGLNSFRAGELVIQHLVELGHKKIAFISTPLNGFTLSRKKRLDGIISKLKEYKLEKELMIKSEVMEYESKDSTYEIEVGFKLTCELIKNESFSAIIGVNDMVAFGAITALTHNKVKVPYDVSVCGFDNIYLSRVLSPNITTVDHFVEQRTKQAVDILIEKINGNSDDILGIEYDPKLIIRESTASL